MKAQYHRACRNCKIAFTTTYPKKTSCSRRCNSAIQNSKRRNTKGIERACLICGSMFTPQQRRGKGRTWCSSACANKLRLLRLAEKRSDNTGHWKGKKRESMLRSKYGIDSKTYDQMLAVQGGGCAICGSANNMQIKTGYRVPLDVDHCHASGKNRGLLCRKCNVGIGAFRDNLDLLEAAEKYLRSHMQ